MMRIRLFLCTFPIFFAISAAGQLKSNDPGCNGPVQPAQCSGKSAFFAGRSLDPSIPMAPSPQEQALKSFQKAERAVTFMSATSDQMKEQFSRTSIKNLASGDQTDANAKLAFQLKKAADELRAASTLLCAQYDCKRGEKLVKAESKK